ncbi:MAG: hypothetical protein LQ340_006407, partial [Diploschistes diacapsis]
MANESATHWSSTNNGRHGLVLGSPSSTSSPEKVDNNVNNARALNSSTLRSTGNTNIAILTAPRQHFPSSSSSDPFTPKSQKVELRQRNKGAESRTYSTGPHALLSSPPQEKRMEVPEAKPRPSWLFLALASGAFAALNGAFAKL